MKRIILLPVLLIFIAGCTQVADQAKTETAKQNVELVKKMIQAYENEDLATLGEIYSPDLKNYGPMIDLVFPYDSVLEGNKGWFKMADSIKYDVIAILAHTVDSGDLAGDWVMLWANVSWYDIKPAKKVSVMYHSPMQIKDGKIVQAVDYWDEWDAYKQLGAKLEWPDNDDEGDMEDND
jgi:ketosteroid isomerase-like protein